MTHFIAVDGEGITHDDMTHDYVLLSVGDRSLHKDGERLTFHDIMPFLYRQFQLNHRSAFIGYYLSYDFSQWLKDLPQDQAWLLLSNEGIALRKRKHGPNPDPFPVRWAGWEFDILGMRRFKIRPANTIYEWQIENVYQWMWICDAGPFWQTSFLNAIDPTNWGSDPVCNDNEWAIIKEGKEQRSTAVFDPSMIQYNVTENQVLVKAMSRMDTGFRSQGWKLSKRQWFGPGQAADTWLRQIGAPLRVDIEKTTPSEVLNAGRCAYYGGWFEIPRHGHIPGTTYEYDINSAYPYIIAGLPCLFHGTWRNAGEYELSQRASDASILCYVEAFGSNPYLGGLPHRDKHGIITRPHYTKGWYWAHEIQSACDAGLLDTVRVLDSWMYRYARCECREPFHAITKLYEQRLSMGKNTSAGKAIRLVYNSAYGKFAQSVGNPKFANSIYASLITAGCRAMILDAIATHPNGARDVMMVATDGIYFRTPHPSLSLSKTVLGAWDVTEKQNMTLFMPGVYWDDKTRASIGTQSVKIKSRGINAKALSENIGKVDDDFRRGFTDWPAITVPIQFSVITPKLALARGKWHTNGTIQVYQEGNPDRQFTKTLSSNPSNKRQPEYYKDSGLLTTRPYADKGESYPYSRTFGSEIEMLIDNDEWISDAGTLNLEIIEILKGITQ